MAILSDCRAAVFITIALSKGPPPESGIEKSIKKSLHARHRAHYDTSISWARGHIGITGNTKEDHLADVHSLAGRLSPHRPDLITPNGLRTLSKASRSHARNLPSFGSAAAWNRQAMSAYTWLRTNKGPQVSWLHRIGKSVSDAHAATPARTARTSSSTARSTRSREPISSSAAGTGRP